MINVIVDTLVFGLQKAGGVSAVWHEYIRRMLEDPRVNLTLLDIRGASYINSFFCELDTSKARHMQERNWNLQILRNSSPCLSNPLSAPVIFQSTYLRTSRQKNVRNVVMIHDITHQIYFHGIRKWLNTMQKMIAISNADGIVYVSENTQRDIHKFFPKSRQVKSVVIYNSANEDYKILPQYEIPERYAEISGKRYFIYVGDRFEYKNTNIFFEILKKTEHLHCVLIGGREFSATEKKMMTGVADRVHRFTSVPNAELNILYNAAFCMIYPSLYEGFGIPVLEAMRAGCPVIAFNNSSIPEVMRGSGFLLENNDVEGCLAVLGKLEDPSVRSKVAEEQLKASAYFDWNASYEKLISFYGEILHSKASDGPII